MATEQGNSMMMTVMTVVMVVMTMTVMMTTR